MLKQEGVEFISGAVAPHKLESFCPCGGGNREGAAITTRLTALPYGQGVGGYYYLLRIYYYSSRI